MSKNNYYIGNFRKDALEGTHHGWFVGKFMENYPRKNSEVEIKYWERKPGRTTHPKKTSSTLEITLILEGKIRGQVDNKPITLEAGQYITIKPNIVNNLSEVVVKECKAITVKAPSDPSAKKVIL